jgi:ribose transport system permease protein
VLPQHWVNVFIGVILILAVLVDIWVRQANLFGRLRDILFRRRTPQRTGAYV